VTIDFKLIPKDKASYNMIYVVVDQLSKQAILVPCYKTVTAEDIARLYINRIYWYFGPPELIISNWGLQFKSSF
jgi:hypothetical protein